MKTETSLEPKKDFTPENLSQQVSSKPLYLPTSLPKQFENSIKSSLRYLNNLSFSRYSKEKLTKTIKLLNS